MVSTIRIGQFVRDTKCENHPIEICGAGCVTQEGEEECHEKTLTSVIDVPEEHCDMNPKTTCQLQTKMVPKLKPIHECTIVPKEVCKVELGSPKEVEKTRMTKWCLNGTPANPRGMFRR